MERFNDDILGLILKRVSDRRDRNSCSDVCKQWARVEGLSRTSIRVLEPDFIPKFLPRFPNLTTFEIDKRVSDRLLESIAEMCPHLRTLNLSLRPGEWCKGFRPKDFGVDGLRCLAAKCVFLTKVLLKRRELVLDAAVVAFVSNAKNLQVFDLSWCSKITDVSLVAMGKMSSLARLYLRGCSQITDEGLISLATGSPSATLRILDMTECDKITDYALCFMPQFSCLQELYLADCGLNITDEGCVSISWISTLMTLDLSWLSNLSDETLFAVAEWCKNLVEITLTGCELITGHGVRAFATHGSLEMISLSHCNSISIEDIEEIVSQCNSLRHLVLDKGLRGWISSPTNEQLSKVHRVDWV